jgi:RHS repeat-associated protein
MIAIVDRDATIRTRPVRRRIGTSPVTPHGLALRSLGEGESRVTGVGMDRLATRTDALGRQESYQYDPAGNLVQFTDRKNQTTTFTYDALNRRIGASYADGSSTAFIYDAVGRLTKATDSVAGAIEFVYDNLDRLSKEISAQGVVEYAYDALGRRSTMKANGATPVSYGYDAASRLTQVAQAGLVVGLGYDNANRRTSLTYPNGTSTAYSYDNASRVTAITHNGPAGLIESLSYAYDAAGNRIGLTRTNGTASNLPAAVQAAYDAANQQIQFNSLPATFDANGNLTTSTDASGTTTYTWDARNRLISQNGPGVSATFQYDALGRRVSKTINSVTTQYLYDGNGIVQEIGGSAVGASYVRSLNIDEPFVRQSATGNEFYHVDALGSTLDLTNQAGAVQASYQYEAFGKTVRTGTSSNPFQYTGRENDGTGIYHYRARYYSPALHRFASEDPLSPANLLALRPVLPEMQVFVLLMQRNPKLLHPYAYTSDTPLNYTDPQGLFFVPGAAVGAAIGALSGIAGAAAQDPSNIGAIAGSAIAGAAAGAIAGGLPFNSFIASSVGGATIGAVADLVGQGIAAIGRKDFDFNPCSVASAAFGGALGNRVGQQFINAMAKAGRGLGTQTAFGIAGGASPSAAVNLFGSGFCQ